ncbi:hypothetical protein BX600DRAFT_472124 [Xylariales sp. PMI_506]|nr:hypothetical protein BX600DRAFT_472124 [Xylariales sp. PMI_506]
MSYDHNSRRYHSPSPTRRHSPSRSDNFLDQLNRGRFREAFGISSSSDANLVRRSNSHHGHGGRGSTYTVVDDDYSYYERDGRSRRGRGPESDYYDVRSTRDTYYRDEDKEQRSRSRRGPSDYDESSSNRRRHHHHQDSRHRTRSAHGPNWTEMAEAAVGAGLIEGFRARRNPEMIKRVATAAVGAAGTAMLVGKDHDHHSKRHVAESAIGGLLLDRVINGSSKR